MAKSNLSHQEKKTGNFSDESCTWHMPWCLESLIKLIIEIIPVASVTYMPMIHRFLQVANEKTNLFCCWWICKLLPKTSRIIGNSLCCTLRFDMKVSYSNRSLSLTLPFFLKYLWSGDRHVEGCVRGGGVRKSYHSDIIGLVKNWDHVCWELNIILPPEKYHMWPTTALKETYITELSPNHKYWF